MACKLCPVVMDLSFALFYSYPSGPEKLRLAKSLTTLFPSLKVMVCGDGEGFVSKTLNKTKQIHSHSQ